MQKGTPRTLVRGGPYYAQTEGDAMPAPAIARLLLVSLVGLFASLLVAAEPKVDPKILRDINDLVKEYKRHGLPLPPANAELVRIDWYHNTTDPCILAFRIPPAKLGDQPRYMIGDITWRPHFDVHPATVKVVKPTLAALERTVFWGFGDEYLCFAIQCKSRGWDELANALYLEAKEKCDRSLFEEVRRTAWQYWRDRAFQRGTDRTELFKHVKKLIDLEPSFLKDGGDTWLKRLELTITPRKSKSGSVEALIDDLTDYWTVEYWGRGEWLDKTGQDAYWKLAELGFDAVPALIDHVQDDRLSRARFENGLGSSHDLTVGHICSLLLYNLSGRTIEGSFSESSGTRLNPDEARKWFTLAQKRGEERWLVDQAVPKESGRLGFGVRPEPTIVRAIAAKYPDRLPEVYQAILRKPTSDILGDYVDEILVSKLTREKQIALFEIGTKNTNIDHSLYALKGLATVSPSSFRKQLLLTLKSIVFRMGKEKTLEFEIGSIVPLCEQAKDRACWDAFREVAKRTDFDGKVTLSYAASMPVPKGVDDSQRLERIRLLLLILNDPSVLKDKQDGTSLEIRDFAASHLAGVLNLPIRRINDGLVLHDHEKGFLSRLAYRTAIRHLAERELARSTK